VPGGKASLSPTASKRMSLGDHLLENLVGRSHWAPATPNPTEHTQLAGRAFSVAMAFKTLVRESQTARLHRRSLSTPPGAIELTISMSNDTSTSPPFPVGTPLKPSKQDVFQGDAGQAGFAFHRPRCHWRDSRQIGESPITWPATVSWVPGTISSPEIIAHVVAGWPDPILGSHPSACWRQLPYEIWGAATGSCPDRGRSTRGRAKSSEGSTSGA